MGYNYYILVQGFKNEQWYDIDYGNYSGTYLSTPDHYFFNKLNEQFKYSGDKDMGENQFLFSFDTLKTDYDMNLPEDSDMNLPQDSESVKDFLKSFVNQDKISKQDLNQIRNQMDNFMKPFENKKQINYELSNYFELCLKNKKEFDQIRIIYGIDY
ncbi:Hypothetical protein KVN_LOCUS395 [uncultured virus]|nr:Hypothetical protein KVN_LOCUS395 [uncultured virus]